MPIIEKDILPPGSYLTGSGVAHFPPARIVRIWQAGQALLRDGFRSQIPYEHHDESVPVKSQRLSSDDREAEKLKHNTGFVKRWYLKPNAEGEPVLWASLDVQDLEAADKLGKTILFVSPQINDEWESGDGTTYIDAPIHVALTNKPVVQGQEPFKPAPVAAGTFRMSCAVPVRKPNSTIILKSKSTAMSAGDNDMPDELNMPGAAGEETVAEAVAPDITSIAVSLSVLTGEQFQAVMAALPEDKQAEFKAACAAAQPEPEIEPNPNGTALSKGEDSEDMEEAGSTKMSLSALAKDPRNERIAKLEGERLSREIDDLVSTGRILPVRASELKKQLTGNTRLSLCQEGYGKLASVVAEIEIRQKLKEGAEAPVGRTKLSVPDRPKHARVNTEVDKKREEEIGEEMGKMA